MEQAIGIKTKNEYLEREKTHKAADILQDIMVMAMLISGAAGQFLTWTRIRGIEYIHMWGMLGVAVIVTVVLGYTAKKSVFGYMAAPLIAVIAGVIHGPVSIFRGFFGIINYMISWWNVSHDDAVALVMEDRIGADDVRACVMILVLVLIPVWWNIVVHRRILVGILIIWAFIIPGLVIHSVSVGACGAFLAGWFGLLLVRGELAFGIRGVVWQLIVCAICICAEMLAGSDRVDSLVRFKNSVDTGASYLRYGRDTLPEGDLTKAANLLVGDDPTLEVCSEQRRNIYLDGFTGASYKDGRWTQLSGARYRGKNDGMFAWLSDRDFIVQDQYACYMETGSDKTVPVNHITVNNIGANRKYIYAPYSAEIPEGTKVTIDNDSSLKAFSFLGADSYEYNDWAGDRPGELLYAENWVYSPETDEEKQYTDSESVYCDFVYDNYLDVDDDMYSLIESVFSAGEDGADDEEADSDISVSKGWDDADTIYTVTEQIRDILSSQTEYVETPDIPEDEDPIEWFLTDGRQGNAVLYASAAVMAFRCKGIPARYAEGYIFPGDSNLQGTSGAVAKSIYSSSDTDTIKITLTNRNSHAWAEVYLDGVGWIPVDVTPGFYYDTYTLLQMVKKPQNVNESASNDDGVNLGNQLDESSEQDTTGMDNNEKKKPLVISLDILVILLMLIVLLFMLLELRYVVRRTIVPKRYEKLSEDGQTSALVAVIFKILSLYGCDVRPGWNIAQTDSLIATGLFRSENSETSQENVFYKGEFIRISDIMEKYIYGGQKLTEAERRTLYIFAEKLYDAGKSAELKTRLKLRYGIV